MYYFTEFVLHIDIVLIVFMFWVMILFILKVDIRR